MLISRLYIYIYYCEFQWPCNWSLSFAQKQYQCTSCCFKNVSWFFAPVHGFLRGLVSLPPVIFQIQLHFSVFIILAASWIERDAVPIQSQLEPWHTHTRTHMCTSLVIVVMATKRSYSMKCQSIQAKKTCTQTQGGRESPWCFRKMSRTESANIHV